MGCVNACECLVTMQNTGTKCQPAMQVAKKIILVPIYDNDGVRNFLNLGVAINQATFTNLINEPDSSKRWYPLPNIKNVDIPAVDPITEEFGDGSKFFIRDGTRTFTALIPGYEGSTTLKSKIEAARCTQMGVYLIDRVGSIYGMISSDGTQLFPMRLESESISAQMVWPTDTTVQKLQIKFDFHNEESDSCIRQVLKTEMDNADLLTVNGLVDVFATYSDISTTGFTVALYTGYGTVLNPVVVPGLVAADFISSDDAATSRLYNETDNANVTITGVTENPDGTYALTFAAQTVADIIVVKPKKNGYDFAAVEASKVTIV